MGGWFGMVSTSLNDCLEVNASQSHPGFHKVCVRNIKYSSLCLQLNLVDRL